MRKRSRALILSLASAILLSTNCGGKSRDEGGNSAPPVIRPLPASAFKVEWGKPEVPEDLQKGQAVTVRVTAKNASDQTWPDIKTADPNATGASAVRLSYRWWDRNMDRPIGDWVGRVELPGPLRPGETVTLVMTVTAPPTPGAYRLQFDLVQELVAWFQDKGASVLTVPVVVK